VQLDLLIIQRYLEGITRLKKGNPKGGMNKDDAMYGSKRFKLKKEGIEVHAHRCYQPKQI
jgi:hypothetical protein